MLPISRRGGLGVSTWEFSDEDLASASRSLSLRSSAPAPCSDGGGPAPAPEGTREEGLLPAFAALMGMPKKEFRGETSPGEVGEAAAGGARNMLVTRLEEGTSDVERR